MAVRPVEWLKAYPHTPFLVVCGTVTGALFANLYGLIYGITIVVPHLMYLPIILASFLYPKRGVLIAVGISAVYFIMVAAIRSAYPQDLISALARCAVFIVIALVVSYLSLRLNEREAELRVKKEEWERTFDAVPDLISIIDQSFRFRRINRAMAARLGISPDKAAGLYCYEMVHRTGSPPPVCPHTLLLHDGREHTAEVHEDNLGGDFLVTASPLRDMHGNLIGSVHVARDITERKRMEDALLDKTKELDRFFSVNLDLLCIADTDGYFRRLNIAWERTLGYTLEELMAHKFLDFVHPQDLQKTLDALSVLTEQKEVINFVNRYRCKDGSYRLIEWRSYPFGKLIYAAARDITERVQAEQATIQANKKLNILSSITRHDILNKITALYAYLDVSREMCTSPAQCEHIDREIETIQALQRQVEFTRYYQDIGVRAPEWQDIETVFKRAVSQIQREGIAVSVDAGGYQVYADPLIEKVFYNMVENSLRHGEHVTSILLTTQKTGDGLFIIYQDNGVGIPAEIKDKLFQRGFGKHTGLGLFLSREILAITGILITEDGESGKGVRFVITVPDGSFRINFSDNKSG